MYQLISESGYITGHTFNPDGGVDLTTAQWQAVFDDLTDAYGRPQWKLIDGQPVKVPQAPTAEDLERNRKRWVLDAIAQRYRLSTEQRITREALAAQATGEPVSEEFRAYHAYVEAVKAESHPRVESLDFSAYQPATES